jgi:hypothetical protein
LIIPKFAPVRFRICHDFRIGRRVYSVPDPEDRLYGRKVLDERRVRLHDVFSRVGTTIVYVYDFGDNWSHDLLLEAILLPDTDRQFPRCIAGERRGPPEDVGGSPGYQYYLEAMADPKHEEHKYRLQWCVARGIRRRSHQPPRTANC